jgi:Arc/MetJ family transcription regulator
MRRTSIEIDDERLTEVQNILGTTGLKDTVEKAFDEVVRAELRRRLADRIASGDGIDRNPITLEASKRW